MGYLNREPVTVGRLGCTHPKVEMAYEYGGISFKGDRSATYTIAAILKDGTRREFSSDDPKKSLADAEAFLETL